ncbi:glycosyltransferase family 2 protein [Agromyces sp. Leaf222]|uniref:glycosyltransferase family 2 protein n=1 Tax=Agromyces sp. Leaf222 TaxID=1735688 RepID=UPI00138F25C7|nr:glycosyltransferase family 2 protein [Agromyces sp. Leaf222]
MTDHLRNLVVRVQGELRALAADALVPIRMRRGRRKAESVEADARIGGWISVILPTKDVERYIDACLRSLLGQGYWRIEVVVVDDGSTDGTRRRLSRWERRDSRVRVLGVDYSDPNAARNHAIDHARGEYLAFLDGDDILLAGAYRDLVESLERTGSDFAVGAYDRLVGRRRSPAAFWVDEAHQTPLERITVAEHPEIMVNAVQWSKLYRRRFWDAASMRFPEGGHFQDQIVSAKAYARAAAFDVLHRRIVSWRIRQDGSSMTQQTVLPRQIGDRFATTFAALELLEHEGGPALARARLTQYLSNDIAIAAAQLPGMGEEAYAALRSGLTQLAPAQEQVDVWHDVPAESKVLYALILSDDQRRARAYIAMGGLDLLRHRLITVDGVPYVGLPYFDAPEAGLSREWFRAAPREIRAFAA